MQFLFSFVLLIFILSIRNNIFTALRSSVVLTLHVLSYVLHKSKDLIVNNCAMIFHSLQHWTKHSKSGRVPWPEERSHHAACCLNYGQQHPHLLVTGGLDRQGKPLADVWILDIERGSWRKVRHNELMSIIIIIYFISKVVYCMKLLSCTCRRVLLCRSLAGLTPPLPSVWVRDIQR